MAQIRLNNVRLSFPVIWNAEAFGDSEKPEFSASFLLPPDHPQMAALEAALLEAANAKWGAKGKAMFDAIKKSDKLCLHDGATKDYDGYEGMMYVNARNPIRPTILDTNKAPLTIEDGRPYGGCYVNVVLEIWAQDNKYGKRINATLMGLQFFRDGESFGGARAADADAFDDVSGEAVPDDIAGMV